MPKMKISDALSSRADWPRIESRVLKDPAVEARIADIVATMSLHEKVGQMTQAEYQRVTPEEVREHYIGSVLIPGGSWPGANKHASPQDWLALADAHWAASLSTSARTPIPILWGTDALHGHNNVFGATLFPHNIGLGAARDPDLIRRIGAATARQMRAVGHGWTFAPTVAVVRDDRWGRTYEGYSEHPAIVRAYAAAMIEGLQDAGHDCQPRLGANGVIATVKHFIGDGGTKYGGDQGVNEASLAEMINIHGEGYFSALEAGAQTVMASYSSWTNETEGIFVGKLHGSRHMLTETLKEKMGFDGVLISDSNGVGQVHGCSNFRCAQAINAGIDIVMAATEWKLFISNTIDLVERGEIPISRIDDAVTRILRVKFRAGLFDGAQPSKRIYAGDASQLLHRDLAREAVQKSLVLLKNNHGVLPLARGQRALVIGKNADSIPNQTGGWTLTWQGTNNTNADFPQGSTILTGIRNTLGDANVVFSENAEAVDVAEFDVVIAVIGEKPYAEGYGDIGRSQTLEHSRRYPEDLAVLEKVNGKGVPVITLFVSGRPLFTNKELNRSDAFIAIWLPGTEGDAVADILFRDADGGVNKDFQGALSYSWPRTACQTPLNYGDENYDPLFPYGFGLNYRTAQHLPLLDETSPAECGDRTPNNDIATKELTLYQERAKMPYSLKLGSPASWCVLVPDEANDGATPDGNIRLQRADVNAAGDGIKVIWSGGGVGQVYLQSERTTDLRPYLNAGGALLFDAIVHQPPLGAVKARIDCIWPCFGELDVTKAFDDMPLNVKQTVKIPLADFAAAGADLSSINTTFMLYAEHVFAVSIANIRWAPEAAEDSDAPNTP